MADVKRGESAAKKGLKLLEEQVYGYAYAAGGPLAKVAVGGVKGLCKQGAKAIDARKKKRAARKPGGMAP